MGLLTKIQSEEQHFVLLFMNKQLVNISFFKIFEDEQKRGMIVTLSYSHDSNHVYTPQLITILMNVADDLRLCHIMIYVKEEETPAFAAEGLYSRCCKSESVRILYNII
jgi:citrate lyase synthetase